MGLKNRLGPYSEDSYAREAAPYTFIFDANETTTVRIYQDEGGFSTTVGLISVSRTSDGEYTLDFNSGRWLKIVVVGVNVISTGDWQGAVVGVTEGTAAANQVLVQTKVGGVLDDPDTPVHVSLRLVSSHGT